ncbi:NUDIX domain-containing protein [Kitasatospora sp. NPDC085895]|uniref:NUDIX domain-containing protein n=1 Tax=Kitasatospora sp. NPDC085895 TaxID=3155057 RepID=UPI00344C2043
MTGHTTAAEADDTGTWAMRPTRRLPGDIGGGVEDEDAGLEAALLREIREEIAGEATDLHPFRELTNDKGEVEHFYTARITSWNFDNRTGLEFRRDDRGEYLLEEVPVTADAVDALNLMPPLIKEALRDAIGTGDLTSAP